MNTQIKELVKKSGTDSSGKWMSIDNAEKFAELIVQECLEACSRTNEIRHFVPPGQQQVVLDCMREIEETFRS